MDAGDFGNEAARGEKFFTKTAPGTARQAETVGGPFAPLQRSGKFHSDDARRSFEQGQLGLQLNLTGTKPFEDGAGAKAEWCVGNVLPRPLVAAHPSVRRCGR